jgi:hypothetical protein
MAHDGKPSRASRAFVAAAFVVAASALLSLTVVGAGASARPAGGAAPVAVASHPDVVTRCPPCIINIVSRNLPKVGSGGGNVRLPADPSKTLPWGVAVSGVDNGALQTTNTTEISIGDLPNGVYHYLIVGPSGWTAANESGSVTLNDDNATVATGFTSAPTHDLTVRESGLPKGTLWCATVASALTFCSSFASQHVANLTPATYAFSVAGVPGYSLKYAAPTSVNLTDGSLSVHLIYRTTLYSLTFDESGLAPATVWRLTLFWYGGSPLKNHHESRSTSGTSLVFAVYNGTYNYSIKAPGGNGVPKETPVFVNGSSVTRDLVFTPIPSPVTFKETGLKAGQTWSITIDNQTYSTNATQLEVNLTDGKYGYSIGPPAGFTGHGSPVSVKVDGSPVTVRISFRSG